MQIEEKKRICQRIFQYCALDNINHKLWFSVKELVYANEKLNNIRIARKTSNKKNGIHFLSETTTTTTTNVQSNQQKKNRQHPDHLHHGQMTNDMLKVFYL